MHERIRVSIVTVVVAAALGTAACNDDPLTVANEEQPDVERAFGTPLGVETIVSKLFQQMHQGQYGTSDNLWTQTVTMSFESASQLGNFGMGTRSQIPRALIDNTIGNREEIGNFRDYDFMSRNSRMAANAIAALDEFTAAGMSIGSADRDARAQAFAYFALGYAHANLALFYDSAAIIQPGALVGEEVPPLSPASEVMEAALEMLDSALEKTTGAAAIPATWLAAPAEVSIARFTQIVRSFKARFRAGVARTPAERAAVDWDLVIDDATNGITADFVVTLSPSAGWTNSWIQQARVSAGWHQMTPFIIGMADTTGAYDRWLQTALMQRDTFLIRTPDRRFPSGETRALQTAKTGSTKAPPDTMLFLRNRPSGEDLPAFPWGTSHYDFIRFWGVGQAGGNGPFAVMTRAEVDMLAAEGYLRKSQFALATPLIDRYRTQNGLPSVAGIADLTTPVPGGSACVPRVPVAPNYTSTACGNLFEAMKWEKRMETAFTSYGQWFLDSRGWGDLVQGTPLEWPVPYQELFARGRQSYRNERVATQGTYRF